MDKKITLEVRLNNTVFKCLFDGNYYNAMVVKGYAIAFAKGVIPQGQQIGINIDTAIICETCWNNSKDVKTLQLKDPSPIIAANPDVLSGIKKPGN